MIDADKRATPACCTRWWRFGLLALRCGFIPKVSGELVIASAVGDLVGSFTALIAPALAGPLGTPTFIPPLGEPMMILWLALVGARSPRPSAPIAPPG